MCSDSRTELANELTMGGCAKVSLSRRNVVQAALVLTSAPLLRYVPALAATAEATEVAPGVFVHQGRYEVQSAAKRSSRTDSHSRMGSAGSWRLSMASFRSSTSSR